jgi:molybdopterin molybdotransferase
MIRFDEAVPLVLDLARPLPAESVPVAEAAGRVLAQDLVARLDSPRAAVSAMDGYAVRSADVAGPGARLAVIGRSLPGTGFDGRLGEGQAVRIFTGAPVPQGADRVVIQENVVREGEAAVVAEPQTGGTHVRAQGSDFRAGAVLLPAGRRLDARAMVAAGAADREALEVRRRPGVVVLGTGDELYEPGSAHLTHFGIPESVSLGVEALAEAWGGRALGRRRLEDSLELLKAAAREALEEADVVVVTGGASVGERDFARAMFEDCGLELVFSKVEMKPGKPVWMGRALGKVVVGLPGNPTSAMVTARLFLAPLVAGLAGADPRAALRWTSEPLAAPLPATGDRETFHRARRTAAGLEPFADQDSGSQKVLADADVLVRRRPGAPAAGAGDAVETLDF